MIVRAMRRLLLLTTLGVAMASGARAHAIHTTQTEIVADAQGMTIRIRTFADDFSASVARFAGRPVPADSSASETDALRYVRAQFLVTDDRGKALLLEPCGMRKESGLYWLCFRVRSGAPLRIRNGMLTELHADQVNIVQVVSGATRRTLLFTRSSAPSDRKSVV